MQRYVLRLSHYLKIGRIVVVLIAVDMVDNFSFSQWTTKHLLSNDSMSVTVMQFAVGGFFNLICPSGKSSLSAPASPFVF
jgi:hypothetical protein